MRINGLNNNLYTYKSNNGNNKEDLALEKRDGLELSEEAIQYQKALSKIDQKPEIREDKVAALKAQIKAGTYEVDAEKIANKMLDNAKMINEIKRW